MSSLRASLAPSLSTWVDRLSEGPAGSPHGRSISGAAQNLEAARAPRPRLASAAGYAPAARPWPRPAEGPLSTSGSRSRGRRRSRARRRWSASSPWASIGRPVLEVLRLVSDHLRRHASLGQPGPEDRHEGQGLGLLGPDVGQQELVRGGIDTAPQAARTGIGQGRMARKPPVTPAAGLSPPPAHPADSFLRTPNQPRPWIFARMRRSRSRMARRNAR